MKCPICGSKRAYPTECPDKERYEDKGLSCGVYHFRCPDCKKEKELE